jgi:5-methyltetrahydrofolate--homocysteine methyltransferase
MRGNLIYGKANEVRDMVKKAIDEGQDVEKILNEGLISGMNIVGEKFKKNEFYIPEMLMAARAMKEGMKELKPILIQKDVKALGTVAIGTVQGDLHDIGKNLVAIMLEGTGFKIIDLGVDVLTEKFAKTVKEGKVQVLALSALLTTTMPAMKEVIKSLEEKGLRNKVKVIIGGAPVTQDYADEIGADGYALDAGSAVDKVRELLSLR